MKTNKLWSILITLVLVLCVTLSFSSCGGDDDGIANNDKKDNVPTTASRTDAIGGEFLKTVYEQTQSNYRQEYGFSYNNKLASLYETDFENWTSSSVSGNEWSFTVKGKQCKYSNVSYDEKGKILSFTASHQSGSEIEEKEYSFSYNQNDQLTQIRSKVIKGSSSDVSVSILWENNNITMVSYGGKYSSKTYTYGQQKNVNNQITTALAYSICSSSIDDLELIRGLALIGKFGKGPQNLPETYSNYAISYKLDNNGNILEESWNVGSDVDRKYVYSYEK